MDLRRRALLSPRDEQSTQQFLDLVADPFSSQFQSASFLASLGTSIGVTIVVALIFCVLRPFNATVYAPRLKHSDQKHAPPPIGKGPFAWITPVVRTKEQALVDKVGLDAAVFMRFTRMCRSIFLTLTVLLCSILIPVNFIGGSGFYKQWTNISTFQKMTPQFMFGKIFWAMVVCAYVIDIVVCGFLWWNYRKIMALRRAYFNSPEYQASLHARTLMITDIPRALRTDEGIIKITDEIKRTENFPRAAIARNVKDLPELIEEHEQAVRDLEKVLAKYLKDPNKLPAQRPTCKSTKKDPAYTPGTKVDAIDYLTSRIKELEKEIREVRESVDKRNAMQYGFASYESIDEAHTVAYAGRKKAPQGTKVTLAPRPNDVLWNNLGRTKKDRRWALTVNQLWVALLTIVWIAPNAMIAVFLSNLSNLGRVWPAFQVELQRDHKTWAVVQGVLAPALTSLFYFFLPSIFRRLSIRAGDFTKTSRERHVTHSLYAFFVFNNLFVFSLFSTAWKYISEVINATKNDHKDAVTALRDTHFFSAVMIGLCNVSPFWISWLLQRNLGAAIDLAQVVNLAWGSIARKWLSPTPRQLIEWSAPPPFDYASYYNYFLFYMTVALCFATLQPIVLPVTALYFTLDTYLKKYLILYVFVTKTESGGQFWRILFNRCLVACVISNIVVALMVTANGYDWNMLYCMVPIPFLLGGFKWYCKRTFDEKIKYYTTGDSVKNNPEAGLPDRESRKKSDRVGVRFGHPALYKPLLTPMVHAKSQHLLKEVYRGRLDDDMDGASVAGYSDTYSLRNMAHGKPGKAATSATAPFEIVEEGKLDFENFKNRSDFAGEHGGDGELYARPGTPSTIATFAKDNRGRSSSRDSERTYTESPEGPGVTYPAGYHKTPTAGFRGESPVGRVNRTGTPTGYRAGDEGGLLSGAAPMGTGWHAPPVTGGTGITPGVETPASEPDTSYDYFRGRRH